MITELPKIVENMRAQKCRMMYFSIAAKTWMPWNFYRSTIMLTQSSKHLVEPALLLAPVATQKKTTLDFFLPETVTKQRHCHPPPFLL